MPVPTAVMMERNSSLASTWSSRFFSTLSGLPRMGNMAWKRRSRPCLALPPALSPSTMNISFSWGLRPVQLLSLPTRGAFSSLFFSRAMLLALRAVSRTLAAFTALSVILAAVSAFCKSSRYGTSFSVTTYSTAGRASVLPRRVLVCPSNWMLCILREMMAVSPSRKSSPESEGSLSLRISTLRQ